MTAVFLLPVHCTENMEICYAGGTTGLCC